jgi:hypothetical protein
VLYIISFDTLHDGFGENFQIPVQITGISVIRLDIISFDTLHDGFGENFQIPVQITGISVIRLV